MVAWLVVIDPQRIFADPASPWGSPQWPAVLPNINRLVDAFAGRVVLTRWVAATDPRGSWGPYLDAWPFARLASDDPWFDLVPALAELDAPVATATTFGKWDALRPVVGDAPHLVLTGVSTDCCVLSTALPAADAGATLTVVTDACAGSTDENQAAALHVLDLYPPQITLATTDEVLAGVG